MEVYSENIHNPERNQNLRALVSQTTSPNEILYYVIYEDYIEVLQWVRNETPTGNLKHKETVELIQRERQGYFIPEQGTYEIIKHHASQGGVMDAISEIIKARNSLEILKRKYPKSSATPYTCNNT